MRCTLAVLLAALAAPQAGIAALPQAALPNPHAQLTPEPPLSGNATAAESRFPRTGPTRESIVVGIDAEGRPVAVGVAQRIVLRAPGDYSFAVPGPVLDVRGAPGARSQPGLLPRAVVWQGFSPGTRELAAVVTLDPQLAGRALPLVLTLRTLVDGRPLGPGERRTGMLDLTLEVRNRTAVTVDAIRGRGVPAELALVLDGLRAAVVAGRSPQLPFVHVASSAARVRVDAGFRLSGELRLPGALQDATVTGGSLAGPLVRFRAATGGDAAPVFRLQVRGRLVAGGEPKLRLEATPIRLVPGLVPPRGGTWRKALASRVVDPDGRALFGATIGAILRIARVNQYEHFLATPSEPEQTGASYRWETATPRAAVAQAAAGGEDHHTLGTVVGLVAAVLGVGAALVVWARL